MSRKTIAFDTEDSNGELKLAVFYDGKNYRVFKNRFQVRVYISKSRKCDFWAHNLEYDICNIYRNSFSDITEMVFSGSSMIWAKVGTNRFYNTMNHYPTSLKKIGEQIGLEKIETDDFFNLEYCKRDTEIVYRFIEILRHAYGNFGVKVQSTGPATAIKIFKKNFYLATMVIPEEHDIKEIRQGYYGGRCEVFRKGVITGNILKYDVNSLYPFVMKKFRFPIPVYPVKTKSFPKYGVMKCVLEVPEMKFPILPVKTNGKLYFPIGEIIGTYPVNLLNYALKNGYKIKEFIHAYSYPDYCQPFIGYVNTMYKLRKAGGHENVIYKRLMNCLYGKFAQGNKRCIVDVSTNDRNEEFLETRYETGDYPKFANQIWSIYTTGYALEQIHRWIVRCHKIGDVLYCDTDSVIVRVNRGQSLPTSKRLGDMKLEQKGKSFEGISPKLYRVDDSIKAKGVKAQYREDYFYLGEAEIERPVRLRESFVTGQDPNVWIKQKKRIISVDDKRRVSPDGDTQPRLSIVEKGEVKLLTDGL